MLTPSEGYQEMDGFGYAITYSACYNLMQMAPADRKAFLTRTYSRTEGYGVSYARISIGCSDFSSTEYSLCDKEGLENFRLHTDETKYVIPVLKEILAINPDLKIMAAPWTCPKWMKVKSLTNRVGYDSWTSGSLNPNHYDTYAEYFVLFVKAFAKEGIPIYAVTPQNEPLNRGNCASLYMPWEEEAAFVNKLAPAFAHAGIKTKIYCFDHNYNYDNIADQQDYPIKFFNALDPDMDGRDLVVGSAWHDYGGSVTELDDINSQAPDKEVIFTETSIGTWNDGRNLSARLLADMQNLVYNTVMRRSKAVMVWNFMLDLNRGPNLDGGCQTCYGAVDIDQNDYHTLSYNSHYYVMAHASLAAHPGARRIGASLSGGASDVAYVAFQNPDGSYGAVISNSGSTSIMMSMSATSNAVARFTLPAKSIVTVVLGGKEDEALLLGSITIKPTKRLGCYKGTVDLKQLDDLSQNFIDNPADWHIAPDFFWYDDADASLTVLPVDGRYEVEIDKAARTLLAAPVVDDLTDDGQGNIYVCGPAGSVGRVFYYPGAETLPENAFAMAEVKDGIYEYTFAIGEQLNDEAIDFAFYLKDDLSAKFSSKATAPHCLVYDSKQGSTYFGLGKGLSGHADGHIYKRVSNVRLKEGSLWTAVVDVRNGLKDASVYIRKAHEIPTGLMPSFRNADGKEKGGMTVGVCYDLQGRRVANDKSKGIYIIRDNDSTRKIARR
jgi:glucosylceramidase